MGAMNQTAYNATGRARISTSSLARAMVAAALLLVGLLRGPLDIIRFLAAPVAEHGRIQADAAWMAADAAIALALLVFLAGHTRDTMGRYRDTPIASVLSSPFSRRASAAGGPPEAAAPTDEDLMAAAADAAPADAAPARPLSARMRDWLDGVRATLTASRGRRPPLDPDVPLQLPPPADDPGKDGVR